MNPKQVDEDALALRKGSTLSSLIADRMEGFILSGELGAGQRINEAVLAKALGVSRGPVREAARLLAARQLVEFVANKGAFVREVAVDEVLEIYDLRAVLTGHACQRAAVSPARDIGRLRALTNDMAKAARKADADGYYRLNLEFHDALVDMAGSARLKEMLAGLIRETHLCRQASLLRHPDMSRSNAEHERIVEAIAAGDPHAARRSGEAHVWAGKERFDAFCRTVATPADPNE